MMEIPLPEIIDRISILRLKIERGNQLLRENFDRELDECQRALEEFEARGIRIDPGWLDKLCEINGFQWDLESETNSLRKTENLEEIGRVYIQLQISNKKRVAAKNEIVKESGEGFQDIKVN